MSLKLNTHQLRIIGCLLEKSLTTPDLYPLSLNALKNACNQKSIRDPVLNLSEIEAQQSLDSLAEKQLIMNQSGHSSRVQKYKHRFCNTEFGDLQFTPQELGIICVLFLRGPQTPGELRTRTNRLCEFSNVQQTEVVLSEMLENGTVTRLDREPGKRESRYDHCFYERQPEASNQHQSNQENSQTEQPPLTQDKDERIFQLEEKVELMQMEIDELRQAIDQIKLAN